MQTLHHAGGTQAGEVPIISDVLSADRHIIGVSLNEHIIILIVGDDLGNLAERFCSTVADLIATALIQHIISQRDIHHTLEHLHVHLFEFLSRERACQIICEHHIERVALALHLHEMTYILIRLIDLVNELFNIYIILTSIVETLVERLLQGLISFAQCIKLLEIIVGIGSSRGQLLPCVLIFLLQVFIFCLAV